jgi:hypothetical protein
MYRSTLTQLFKNVPDVIDPVKIDKITDKSFLLKLEDQYDKFLENNIQLLDLYNFIDDLFNIRDAILIKLNRIEREETVRRYNEQLHKKSSKPEPNISVEYNCGCQELIYYTPTTEHNNCHHYCVPHLELINKKSILENELTKVKTQISSIKKSDNIKNINYNNNTN